RSLAQSKASTILERIYEGFTDPVSLRSKEIRNGKTPSKMLSVQSNALIALPQPQCPGQRRHRIGNHAPYVVDDTYFIVPHRALMDVVSHTIVVPPKPA